MALLKDLFEIFDQIDNGSENLIHKSKCICSFGMSNTSSIDHIFSAFEQVWLHQYNSLT